MPTKPPAKSKPRAKAKLKGGGAIAQGKGAIALGEKATYAEGDLYVIKGTDPASRALRTHLTELRTACCVLPIAAMGGDEEARRDVSLDQVYIALDTTTPAPKPKGAKARSKAAEFLGRDEARLPVLDAVIANPHVVLLGGPGSGKSSFVNQLIADIAAARTKQAHNLKDAPAELLGRMPVKIVLRELAERFGEAKLTAASPPAMLRDAVWAHICEDLTRAGAGKAEDKLRALIAQGKGLLVFDGLDEVSQESRLTIRKAVGAVLAQYGSSRVIVTCRSRSYPDSRFEGFAEFTLGTLTEEQVQAFVAAWYHAHVALKRMSQKEADARIADLTRAALRSYRALASESPLLLTIMAIVHRKGVSLPNEEVRLYQQAVDVLISRWQQEKKIKLHADVEKLLADANRLDAIMQDIAYEQHALQGATKDPQALLPRHQLVDLLGRADLLGPDFNIAAFLNFVDSVSGILIGHGGSEQADDKRPLAYGFPHRTFQEYLAGRRMMWGGAKQRKRMLLERAAEGDYWANAARYGWEALAYLGNTRNDDLAELAAALCAQDAPQTDAQWRATGWAGRMAALVGGERIQAYAADDDDSALLPARMKPRLLSIMTEGKLPAIERAEAGDALAALGDPRFCAERFALPCSDDWGFIDIPAGPFRMGTAECDWEGLMAQLGVTGRLKQNKDFREWFEAERYPGDNSVALSSFSIARYAVTVAQFQSFAAATDQTARFDRALRGSAAWPVVGTTWREALEYCTWLTVQMRTSVLATRFSTLYPAGWEITLPSEAQWERAARGASGGNPNPTRVYAWEDDALDGERANVSVAKVGKTSTVGLFPAGVSPEGCLDMIGNVWEWTRSAYVPYPYREYEDRDDVNVSHDRKVVRGGAFHDNQYNARCAFRYWRQPGDRNLSIGFRVCVSPISR
jgi:formylglycine-generating enzyme required for sulfatase activity